jgi:hypothetical protein
VQHLGLRQLEWLFFTSHNHRHDQHPFLMYYPMISTQDLPEPFRAFLGALLSILKNFPVEPSEFKPKLEFDTIERRETPDLEPGDDIEDEGILWQLSIGSHPLPAYFVFNLHPIIRTKESM